MCLAVPGRILSISGDDQLTRTAKVSFGGVVKDVSLAYVPEACVDEYVLVHAGFALSRVDEEEALKTLEELNKLAADPDEEEPLP
jgi:hydrogenase expression/formation protein HypC